jgi:hypothetical protein
VCPLPQIVIHICSLHWLTSVSSRGLLVICRKSLAIDPFHNIDVRTFQCPAFCQFISFPANPLSSGYLFGLFQSYLTSVEYMVTRSSLFHPSPSPPQRKPAAAQILQIGGLVNVVSVTLASWYVLRDCNSCVSCLR